jgi:hypothetical protein
MPMASYKNTSHSPIYVILVMVAICLLSIAEPRIIRPFVNRLAGNMTLWEFETAFQDIQHPTGTEPLSLRTAVGDFADSEQGCDFFLGEVRRYDGNEEVIRTAYVDQAVMDNPIQVLFLEDGRIPAQMGHSLPEPLGDLAGWELPSEVGRQPLYMVYLMVVGYEGDLRLDCR